MRFAGLTFAVLSFVQLVLLMPSEMRLLCRAIFGFLSLTVLISLCGLISVGLQVSLPSDYIFIAIFFILFFLRRFYELPPLRLCLTDVCALVLMAFTVCSFLPSLSPGENGIYLPIPSKGEDAISHLSLYLLAIQEKAFLHFRDHLQEYELQGLLHYPQAFHYSAAVFFNVISDFFSLDALVHSVSFFVAVVIFLSSLLAPLVIYASEFCAKGKKDPAAFVIGVIFALVVLGSWLSLYLSIFGFYSQIYSLILYLAFLHLISLHNQRSFLLAVLIECGITAGWFFLSPVTTVVLLYSTYRSFGLFTGRQWAAIWGLSLAIKTAFVAISLAGISSHNALIQPGGITLPPDWIFYWTCGLGLAVYFWLLWRKKAGQLNVYFAAFFVSAGFSTLLYLYQVLRTGSVSYYFYKSLYTVFMPATVLTVAGCMVAGVSIREYFAREKRIAPLLLFYTLTIYLTYSLVSSSANHISAQFTTKINLIDAKSYRYFTALRRLPEIKERYVFLYTADNIDAYLKNRLIAVLAGSKSDWEFRRMPLEAEKNGYTYLAWLYKYLSEESFDTPVILLDIYRQLRNDCGRNFFRLQESGKVKIVPRNAAIWDEKLCGKL